jgi:hypothetical protein
MTDFLLKSSPVTTSDTGNFCAAITSLIRAMVSPVRISSEMDLSRLPKYQIIIISHIENNIDHT